MPQDVHVLKCHKCNTYQADIVKKVKRWTCKMCGEKQSVVKVYGNGSGKDCRTIVQHLNAIRISKGEGDDNTDGDSQSTSGLSEHVRRDREDYKGTSRISQWTEFLPPECKESVDFDGDDNTGNRSKYRENKADNDFSINKWSEFIPTTKDKDKCGENEENIDFQSQSNYYNNNEECDDYHMRKRRRLQQASQWTEFIAHANLDIEDHDIGKNQFTNTEDNVFNKNTLKPQKVNLISNKSLITESVYKNKPLRDTVQCINNNVGSIF